MPIFGVLNNGLSYYTAAVFLKQTSGGDLVLEAYCVTGGYFEGTTVLSASTQYHVEVEFDNSGGAGSDILKMWVNDSGTPEVNQTAIDCATDLSSYAIIGGAAAGLEAAANFVIDGIQIDDDTDPE